jgi:hypothetical protein
MVDQAQVSVDANLPSVLGTHGQVACLAATHRPIAKQVVRSAASRLVAVFTEITAEKPVSATATKHRGLLVLDLFGP